MQTKVVNFIGGPGIGKTTLCALIFAELKKKGFIVEYVQEYAKHLVWTKDFELLNNQYFVSQTQFKLLDKINGQVQFILTDGPIIQGVYYNKYNPDNMSNVQKVEKYIINSHNKFNNINILLKRGKHKYEEQGRLQNEKEAIEIDNILKNILDENNLKYLYSLDFDEIIKFILSN